MTRPLRLVFEVGIPPHEEARRSFESTPGTGRRPDRPARPDGDGRFAGARGTEVGPPRCLGVVVRGGARGEIRSIVDRLLQAGGSPHGQAKAVEKPGGRTLHTLGTSPQRAVAWWPEGDDLVVSLASPTGADAIIA